MTYHLLSIIYGSIQTSISFVSTALQEAKAERSFCFIGNDKKRSGSIRQKKIIKSCNNNKNI